MRAVVSFVVNVVVVSSQRPRDKMPSAHFGDAHVLLAQMLCK